MHVITQNGYSVFSGAGLYLVPGIAPPNVPPLVPPPSGSVVLDVIDCLITNNVGGQGPAITIGTFGTANFIRTTVRNNTVFQLGSPMLGGAILVGATGAPGTSKFTADQSLFIDNRCDGFGGAIYAGTAAVVSITNSRFIGNRAAVRNQQEPATDAACLSSGCRWFRIALCIYVRCRCLLSVAAQTIISPISATAAQRTNGSSFLLSALPVSTRRPPAPAAVLACSPIHNAVACRSTAAPSPYARTRSLHTSRLPIMFSRTTLLQAAAISFFFSLGEGTLRHSPP